jgi:L-fuconolactonase
MCFATYHNPGTNSTPEGRGGAVLHTRAFRLSLRFGFIAAVSTSNRRYKILLGLRMNRKTNTVANNQSAGNRTLSRRKFVASAASVAALPLQAEPDPIPIIDTHVHFFDTTRPQGVPYPDPNGIPGVPVATPETYRKAVARLGIVGAIEVEASPWVEDNLWVLEIAAKDTIVVGTIGNLEPDKPEFPEYLERYHRNPLFRGIRYGNLWKRSLTKAIDNPDFISGIKLLSAADLTFDTANPNKELLKAIIRLTDKVPDLRVVLDHMPTLDVPSEPAGRHEYEATLRELARRNTFAKLSAVAQRVNGQVQTDLAFYKPRLDLLCDVFGEDRVVFGSDWPNSTGNWVSYQVMLPIVQRYFQGRGRAAAEKYFWKNSITAYRWIKRDPGQPDLPGRISSKR